MDDYTITYYRFAQKGPHADYVPVPLINQDGILVPIIEFIDGMSFWPYDANHWPEDGLTPLQRSLPTEIKKPSEWERTEKSHWFRPSEKQPL